MEFKGLEKEFKELEKVVIKLNQTIDKKFEPIIEMEKELNKLKTFYKFSLKIEHNNKKICEFHWLKDNMHLPTKFCFFIEAEDQMLEKFLRCNLETRLKYVNYFPNFIKEFTKFLQDKIEGASDGI